MSIVPLDFRPFSVASFDATGRRGLRNQLIINSSKIHTASLLRKNRDELARRSSGLVEMLSGWCEDEPSIQEAMGLPLSLKSLRYSEQDPVWIAALSAAYVHNRGRAGHWRASLSSPARVAFGNRITDLAREIEVSARDNSIQVKIDGGPMKSVDELESFRVADLKLGNSQVALLGARSEPIYPLEAGEPFCEIPAEEITASLQEAFSILRSWAPDYRDWVEDGLSAVAPLCHHRGTHLQSFSVPGINGVMFASFPTPPLKVAELLVHEASHQYFHYAQLKTLFANGMDKATYWSPYVEMERPIDRILISFHAFANIVIFYRDCLAAGMNTNRDAAEREIDFNMKHLPPMSRHLEQSTGLTPAGRSLFEPLRDELYR